jgi:3-hydroxyisobutyrate dehydrogenase
LKLAINLPMHVYFQALGESYVLCKHLGLDPKWLVDFLTETSGAANILKRRGNNIAAALAGGDVGPPAWDIDLTRKDLALMVSEGKKLGTSLPLTERRSPYAMRPRAMAGAAETPHVWLPIGLRASKDGKVRKE